MTTEKSNDNYLLRDWVTDNKINAYLKIKEVEIVCYSVKYSAKIKNKYIFNFFFSSMQQNKLVILNNIKN